MPFKSQEDSNRFSKKIQEAGYDSIVKRGQDGEIVELVVFEPNKIKSAIGNRGTYDINEADINKAGGGIIKKAKALLPKGQQAVLPAEESAENLQKFLGNSRIRDVLYHATPKSFAAFKPGGDNPKISGPAIWLTPDAKNQPAAHNIGSRSQEFREGTNVMPVYAQARSPLMLDDELSLRWAQEVYANGSREFPELLAPQWVQELKKEGYDSIIFADPLKIGQQHEVMMFEPNRIKSAIGNRGTYDIEEADINKAKGGQVSKDAMWIALQNKQLRKKHGN